jgi:hypothetical protein
MTDPHSFLSTDHLNRNLDESPKTVDRVLNAAIVHADIAENFEKYLEIFQAFYADDIEVTSDTQKEPIRGKAKVRSLLFDFLVPLHVMAEIGGLSVSIRQTEIPGDGAHETHSAWTLELTGVSGATCTLSWCALRIWNGARVVHECHYDHQQSGGPLTFDDLDFNMAKPLSGFRRPS